MLHISFFFVTILYYKFSSSINSYQAHQVPVIEKKLYLHSHLAELRQLKVFLKIPMLSADSLDACQYRRNQNKLCRFDIHYFPFLFFGCYKPLFPFKFTRYCFVVMKRFSYCFCYTIVCIFDTTVSRKIQFVLCDFLFALSTIHLKVKAPSHIR